MRPRSSTPISTEPRTASSPSSGDFDEAAVTSLVAELFGDWKSAARFERVPQVYQDVAAGEPSRSRRRTRPTPSSSPDRTSTCSDDDPDYPGARARQLHARRRLPELAARRPHPPEGRPLLRRRLAGPGLAARQGRLVHDLRDLRAAERGEARGRVPGRARARPRRTASTRQEVKEAKSGWLQSRQVTRAQDAALARTLSTRSLHPAHARLGRRVREEGRGAHGRSRSWPRCASTSTLRRSRSSRPAISPRAPGPLPRRAGPLRRSDRMNMNPRPLILAALVSAAVPAGIVRAGDATPPAAPKVPHMQTLHGDNLEDDYFWMRERDNPKVRAFLEAENAYTESFMKPTEPLQKTLYDEMLGRIKQTDLSVPYREGGWYYYSRTEKGKQYPIYCRKKGSLEAAEEVYLDVNALAEGQRFMSVGGPQRQRRRPPARLHDGQHGVPRLHALDQGPLDRKALSRARRARFVGRVGGGQQDALLHDDRSGQAAVPALSARSRRGPGEGRAPLRGEGRDVPGLRRPFAAAGRSSSSAPPRTPPASGAGSRRPSRTRRCG